MSAAIRYIKSQPAPSVVNQHAAQVSGSVAQGQALADQVVAYARNEGNTLKGFLKGISELSQEGRTAFRATLDVTLKAITENIKALGNTTEAKRAAASARTRISECRKFSVACDLGFSFTDNAHETYTALIALSGKHRDAQASGDAVGPTRRRGRQPTTWQVKLAKYVEGLGLDAEGLREACRVVAQVKPAA